MVGIINFHVEFGGGAEGGGGGGTGGFLVNAHQHILEKATSKDILEYDADGMAHHLIGNQLQDDARKFMKGKNTCADSTTTQA